MEWTQRTYIKTKKDYSEPTALVENTHYLAFYVHNKIIKSRKLSNIECT